MSRWLLIAGDFTPLGGMDRANHALASSLAAAAGREVHLVAHRVWPDLAAQRASSCTACGVRSDRTWSARRSWRPRGSGGRRRSPAAR